eukprot:m.31530 g.31530  ORF g.31530 m.31530 type:complete len:138 (-) comp13984_c0_seq1:141-554(-)
MPHGDFSDIAGLACVAGGVQLMYKPSLQYNAFVPQLQDSFSQSSSDVEALLRMLGGFFVALGCILITVRWNTINGKLSGLGMIGCGVNIGYTVFKRMDNEVLVIRPAYLYAATLVLAGIKVMFFANPMIVSKEKKNA